MVIELENQAPDITIERLRLAYPDAFYNQDWYEDELFYNGILLPVGTLVFGDYGTSDKPSAVALTWLWLTTGRTLWPYTYVWASDVDRDGNRIYVGGFKKGRKVGFQIHRHLKDPGAIEIPFVLT